MPNFARKCENSEKCIHFLILSFIFKILNFFAILEAAVARIAFSGL